MASKPLTRRHRPAQWRPDFPARLAVKTDNEVHAALALAATRREIWHPLLKSTVYAKTVRGEYERAVLEAFKLLEVAVRAAFYESASFVQLEGRLPPQKSPIRSRKLERAVGHAFAPCISDEAGPPFRCMSSQYSGGYRAGRITALAGAWPRRYTAASLGSAALHQIRHRFNARLYHKW